MEKEFINKNDGSKTESQFYKNDPKYNNPRANFG
jgi:hypothetical protein